MQAFTTESDTAKNCSVDPRVTTEGLSVTIERYCRGLRWPPRRPVLGRAHSGRSLERSGEVRLVCETGRQSDLDERIMRRIDLMAREVDAPMAKVFTYALVVVAAE